MKNLSTLVFAFAFTTTSYSKEVELTAPTGYNYSLMLGEDLSKKDAKTGVRYASVGTDLIERKNLSIKVAAVRISDFSEVVIVYKTHSGKEFIYTPADGSLRKL